MGEIFSWVRSQNALPFTGERWTSAATGQIELEHLHRYLAVRELCRGKDVLDIACGEGYGAVLLSEVARSVIGVDIDAASIAHASRQYVRSNLNYVAGDARRVPLATGRFDVVVSFETLEHFAEQDEFLADLRRVLRPDGLLIISTPDSDVYSPLGHPANHYHIRELSREEFFSVLSTYFGHIVTLAQRPLIGSAIVPRLPNGPTPAIVTYERRDDTHFEASQGLPRPLYLIACAGNRPLQLSLGTSFYIHSGQVDAFAEAAGREVRTMLAEAQAELAVAQAELAQARIDGDARLSEALQRAESWELQALGSAAALKVVLDSTSWRLLEPIRRIGMRHPRLARVVRMGPRLAWSRVRLRVGWRRRGLRNGNAAMRLAQRCSRGESGSGQDGARRQEGRRGQMLPEQARALGLNFQPPAPRDVAVGIVTYNTDAADLRKVISSTRNAMRRAGLATTGRVLVLDNGIPTDGVTAGDSAVRRLASAGNVGFGRGHNLLMQAAFDDGADLYVTVNPDGMLHPDALVAILQMTQANDGRALIEASQFPEEHPKIYDRLTFDTPWASGACLAIPRIVAEAIGRFDETFFMYCEDVDLSWRARAAGFSVKLCPRALFLHATTNRPVAATRPLMLSAGVILARKWGSRPFEEWLVQELRLDGRAPPAERPQQVPEALRAVADFSHQFSFAPVRW